MKKFNPMFQLREKDELKTMYKKPYFYISIVALLLVLIPLLPTVGFYQSASAIRVDTFLRSETLKPLLALILIIYGIATTFFIVLCNIFFRNSAKLSLLNAIIASVFLFLNFFVYLAYSKGVLSGYLITNFGFAFGSIAFIISSLLILGHEFYKMGWEGYYVVVEDDAKGKSVATDDVATDAKEKFVESNEIDNDEEIEQVQTEKNDEENKNVLNIE